jgi:D-alanyl-D-alanine carboxypeptidase
VAIRHLADVSRGWAAHSRRMTTAPNLIGHDGQIPGYTTLAVYDPHIDLLVVVLTDLYETPDQKVTVAPLLSPIVDRFYGRTGDVPTTSDAAPTTTKES